MTSEKNDAALPSACRVLQGKVLVFIRPGFQGMLQDLLKSSTTVLSVIKVQKTTVPSNELGVTRS